MENKFYGLTSEIKHSNDFLCDEKEELCINGYVIIENVFSNEELDNASNKLDLIHDLQVKSFGEENLKAINEQNLVRSPLVYDDFFLTLVRKETIAHILEYSLGNYYVINQQNGIINMPNEEHHQSSWHRDLPYQNYVVSKPIAISVMICIDDFTQEMGSTVVLPFTHRLDNIPSVEYINKFQKSVVAKRGSAIIFNAMLFHKAGYNQSNNIRRGLNTLFTIPLISQQINLSTQMPSKYADDPYLRKLLGYEIQTPISVQDWRESRLKRIK